MLLLLSFESLTSYTRGPGAMDCLEMAAAHILVLD